MLTGFFVRRFGDACAFGAHVIFGVYFFSSFCFLESLVS